MEGQGSTDGKFQDPRGTAVDDTHIYVADTNRNDVQVFDKGTLSAASPAAPTFVTKFGASGSEDGQFQNIHGIAVDNTYIYVADTSRNDVQVFRKSDRGFVAKFGGTGTENGEFTGAWGIAVDNTHIYVTDVARHDVQAFDKGNLSAATPVAPAFIAKFGSSGAGNGQFRAPYGIAVDNTYIYVADEGRDDVQVFTKSTRAYASKFGGRGTENGKFTSAWGVAVNNTHIYVTDALQSNVKVFRK